MVTKLPNLSTISGVSRFFLNNRNIAICILLNTIVIFLLSFHRFQYVLLPLDVAFTIFFIIEMIIKIKYFGIFGMGFVSSVFIDEVTSDNNDEVLQRLTELEKILKKIQNGTT